MTRTHNVTLRLTERSYRLLKQAAEADDRTPGGLARWLVERALARAEMADGGRR